MRTPYLRRVVASLTASLTILSFAVATQAGASVNRTVSTRVVTPAVSLPHGAVATGAVPSGRTLKVDLYLAPRSESALNAFTAAVTSKHSALYGHYLSRGEFAKRFGATPATIAAVRSTLVADGLRVTGTNDGLIVTVTGHVSTFESAFDTSLTSVRLANGTKGMAATSAVRLPSSIAKYVSAVIGLDNLVHLTSSTKSTSLPHKVAPKSHIKWPSTKSLGRNFPVVAHESDGGPSACSAAVATTEQGYGGITDDQVATADGADGLYSDGDFASGQTVAIYELEPFEMSDIAQFEECYLGANETSHITTTNVDGGPGVGPGSGESVLDIENVAALAPDANIDVYQAPNTDQGALDAYGAIVANDTAKVVTTSWGLCEQLEVSYSPGSLAAEHSLFEQAAAQGQTVFAAAGDNGNDDCARDSGDIENDGAVLTVDDPGSQPYVVSVGGTTAISMTDPPVQQVWNDGEQGGAGGGGDSSLWSEPAWQAADPQVATAGGVLSRGGVDNTCGNTGTATCRVVPDVSAFADEYTGITIVYDGGWYTIGGTSSAAPIWAATLAEVNASSACTSVPSTADGVGFVSPLLYQVAENPSEYATSFNDVTTGNNDIYSLSLNAYAAGTGYDAASGLGTPDLYGTANNGLAANLCAAAQDDTTTALTSVSPTSGSVAGNTKVTITGTDFETGTTSNVAGVSFGDFPASSFSVKSPTEIVALTPPAGVPKLFGKTFTAGQEGLVSVTYTSGHIATGPTFSFDETVSKKLVPTVVSVGNSGGPTAGGNTVNVYGTGFTAATAVTFGGVAATSFTVESDSLITAVVPAQQNSMCLAGSHSVVSGLCQTVVQVTTPNGSSATVTPLKPLQGSYDENNEGIPYAPSKCECELFPTITEYDYQAAPTVTKVITLDTNSTYKYASPYGGEFEIEGTGFNYLTLGDVGVGVDWQNNEVPYEYNVHNTYFYAEDLSDPSPAPSVTTESVTVTSLGGISGSSSAATIQFGGVPEVTALSSSVIASSGNAVLTITGLGFGKVGDVEFDNESGGPSTESLANFERVNATTIEVLEPSLVPGNYLVTVDGLYGNSSLFLNASVLTGEPAASYQTVSLTSNLVTVIYPGGQALIGSSDNSCTVEGGCSLTLTGLNMNPTDPTTIHVGTQVAPITSFTETDGVDTIVVTVPASFDGLEGTYAVTATTPEGITPETLDAYVTYTLS